MSPKLSAPLFTNNTERTRKTFCTQHTHKKKILSKYNKLTNIENIKRTFADANTSPYIIREGCVSTKEKKKFLVN